MISAIQAVEALNITAKSVSVTVQRCDNTKMPDAIESDSMLCPEAVVRSSDALIDLAAMKESKRLQI